MINAALIGFGLAGRFFHLPLLQAAGITVRVVVSRQRDVVLSALPHAEVVSDESHLWSRSDIDVVVIATPNHLHAQQARAALQANMHVVVDKPMCLRSAEADELIRLAHAQRRMVTSFQNRRWDADFLTIRRLINTGQLGELNAFHARWDRFRPSVADRWREHDIEGNGVLYDLGAHLIDQALCLFGVPDWVQADVFAQRPGARAADGFELLLAKQHARITLGVSTLAANGGPRYRIHGTNGSYVKSGIDVQEPQLRAQMLATDSRFGVEPDSQWGTFTDGATNESEVVISERGTWTQFYTQVAACIQQGAQPPVPAQDAKIIIRVIEAAMQSSEQGVRVALG